MGDGEGRGGGGRGQHGGRERRPCLQGEAGRCLLAWWGRSRGVRVVPGRGPSKSLHLGGLTTEKLGSATSLNTPGFKRNGTSAEAPSGERKPSGITQGGFAVGPAGCSVQSLAPVSRRRVQTWQSKHSDRPAGGRQPTKAKPFGRGGRGPEISSVI